MELSQLLQISEFTDFPFDLKPSKSPQVWAGRTTVLKQLEEFRFNVEVNHLVEFGVLSGDHGSGKSHSLRHLQYLIETKPIQEGTPLSKSIYIDNPTGIGPKGTFMENYRYIINQSLGASVAKKIFAHGDEVINKISTDKAYEIGKEKVLEVTQNEEKQTEWRQSIYNEVIGESPITYRMFKAIADDKAGAWDWLSVNDSSSATVAGEEVQPLTSHILCAKALSTIIKLATIRQDAEVLYAGMFVFLDQTEDIATLKPGPFQEQIMGWRTLLDEVEKNFGMIWAMDGSAEDVAANFTDAIERRQTVSPEQLRLLPLEEGNAETFLKDVMKYFRKQSAKIPSEIYPFNEAGLKEVVTATPNRTPSALLTSCRTLFTRAARFDIIKSTKDALGKEDVRKLLSGE